MPLPEDTCPLPRSRDSKPKVNSCLPFCHSQRKPTHLLSSSQVESLNSRYLTPKRHWQLSLLCSGRDTPPNKMKPSWPMGENQLAASGHGQFLAKATSLHNPGKCKQSYTQITLFYTCVEENRGTCFQRVVGLCLGAR